MTHQVRGLADLRIRITNAPNREALGILAAIPILSDGAAEFSITYESTPMGEVEASTPGLLDTGEACVTDGANIWFADGAGLQVRKPSSVTIHTASRGAGDPMLAECASLAFEMAVEARGGMTLHAASLRHGAGWALIFAESGTGKTTASLALAKTGGGLGGDDAAILLPGEEMMSCPLPRDLHVHHRTEALLPWLADLEGKVWGEDERALSMAELSRALPCPAPAPLPITALILLERSDAPYVVPRSAAEILPFLIADHVRKGAGGLADGQLQRLDLLSALAGEAPAYAVSLGALTPLWRRRRSGPHFADPIARDR